VGLKEHRGWDADDESLNQWLEVGSSPYEEWHTKKKPKHQIELWDPTGNGCRHRLHLAEETLLSSLGKTINSIPKKKSDVDTTLFDDITAVCISHTA
jgi:hypothetical protein